MAACAAYGLALSWTARGLTVDYWDGLQAMANGLLILGEGRANFSFAPTRPPLDCLVLAPVLKAGLWLGLGPAPLVRLVQSLMALVPALLVFLSWRWFRRWSSPAAATLAAGAFALNPLMIRYAPFALFDIFAALLVIPTLEAGWRCIESPGPRTYLKFLALYCAAVLFRYQHCLLWAPILPGLVATGSGLRLLKKKRAAVAWLALTPALAYALCVAFMTLLLLAALGEKGFWGAVGVAHQGMLKVFTVNTGKVPASVWVYLGSLGRQLGPGLLVLALAGIWSWIASREDEKRFRAMGLALPLLALCAVANKEERYLLAFSPLLYAAVAAGVDRLGATSLVLALGAALLPWRGAYESWTYLAQEPSLRTQTPAKLAALLERETPPGTCVLWDGGDLVFKNRLSAIGASEQMPMLGAQTAQFYAGRWIVEPRYAPNAPCPVKVVVAGRDSAAVFRGTKKLATLDPELIELGPDQVR